MEHGNLRELALARMKEFGTECRDVRTREVGIQEVHHKVRPYQVSSLETTTKKIADEKRTNKETDRNVRRQSRVVSARNLKKLFFFKKNGGNRFASPWN